MGGGGFTMEPENRMLDSYVLSSSRKEKPYICFLPTASGDNLEYIHSFYEHFENRKCFPSHLSLSYPPTSDLEDYLLDKDIVYVGGGHTGQMLARWKVSGLDKILKKAWNQGVLLAGVSSGSACWFEEALTDSVPDKLTPEKCLGFLKGSTCSHYNNPERRPTFHQLIRTGEMYNGIGVDNSAALYFEGRQLIEAVCSVRSRAAFFVRKDGERTIEEKLPTAYLGLRR
jgi:peptidase E